MLLDRQFEFGREIRAGCAGQRVGVFLQGNLEQEIIQQLPPYTVTRVDSVSRPPLPSVVTQKLGPKLGAVLGICNHSFLA